MGGGGGGSGPTVQQRQLETQQAVTNANLNLEENAQRKAILNSMMGTRVFKGSALSRAMRGNTPGTGGEGAAPAPSATQTNAGAQSPVNVPTFTSILDQRQSDASGATPAGGAGASASPSVGGGRVGGGGSNRGPIR